MLHFRLTAAILPLTLIAASLLTPAREWSDPRQTGPYGVSQFTRELARPGGLGKVETVIYYPSQKDGQLAPNDTPYPTLVFARGFLSQPNDYAGHGEHLASWGYIVAIPHFPSENIEDRAAIVQFVFSWLEKENGNPDSLLYAGIDPQRFGVLGHSMGGNTTLMIAAREPRVRAAVALDPVNPPSGWDADTEAPDTDIPLLILAAPSQMCNYFANYNRIFSLIGSTHKTKIVLTDGSHCDFMDTTSLLRWGACYMACGGEYRAWCTDIVHGYTTAWFNYYLCAGTDYFDDLYGSGPDRDLAAGRISVEVHSAPQDVVAHERGGAVELMWRLDNCAVIDGYNIYRRRTGESYGALPYARVGRDSLYVDTDVNFHDGVATGPTLDGVNRYYYVIRARDAAGNEHQPSVEVAVPPLPEEATYLPFVQADGGRPLAPAP